MFVLCHMSPQFWSSDPAVQSPDILHPWGRLQDEEFSIRGPCKFRRLSHWQDRTYATSSSYGFGSRHGWLAIDLLRVLSHDPVTMITQLDLLSSVLRPAS